MIYTIQVHRNRQFCSVHSNYSLRFFFVAFQIQILPNKQFYNIWKCILYAFLPIAFVSGNVEWNIFERKKAVEIDFNFAVKRKRAVILDHIQHLLSSNFISITAKCFFSELSFQTDSVFKPLLVYVGMVTTSI